MVVNLIEKYGVVPKTVFPESFSSSSSRTMNRILTSLLREFAQKIRLDFTSGLNEDAIRQTIPGYLEQLHRVLLIHLGTPPSKFSWSYYNNDKAFCRINGITPVEFYKQHAIFDVAKFVSLIHDPRNEANELYTIKYLGNVIDGVRPIVKHLNLEMGQIRAYAKQQIDDGSPVWFGCDSGERRLRLALAQSYLVLPMSITRVVCVKTAAPGYLSFTCLTV